MTLQIDHSILQIDTCQVLTSFFKFCVRLKLSKANSTIYSYAYVQQLECGVALDIYLACSAYGSSGPARFGDMLMDLVKEGTDSINTYPLPTLEAPIYITALRISFQD